MTTLLQQLTSTKTDVKRNLTDANRFQIDQINEVLTEVKNMAVDQKTTVDALTDEQVTATIKLVVKRRFKTIKELEQAVAKQLTTAQAVEAAIAQANLDVDYLNTLIPDAFRDPEPATEAEMRAFVDDLKANGTPFGKIMGLAKAKGNYDLRFIQTIAK